MTTLPLSPRNQPTRTSLSINEELGAGNEIRTRDPNLGKVVLYQLSYSRYADPIFQKLAIRCQAIPWPCAATGTMLGVQMD